MTACSGGVKRMRCGVGIVQYVTVAVISRDKGAWAVSDLQLPRRNVLVWIVSDEGTPTRPRSATTMAAARATTTMRGREPDMVIFWQTQRCSDWEGLERDNAGESGIVGRPFRSVHDCALITSHEVQSRRHVAFKRDLMALSSHRAADGHARASNSLLGSEMRL